MNSFISPSIPIFWRLLTIYTSTPFTKRKYVNHDKEPERPATP
jgi:hypothetical protein